MFSGSALQLIEELLSQIIIQGTGADLVAFDPVWKLGLPNNKAYIDEDGISKFLDQ